MNRLHHMIRFACFIALLAFIAPAEARAEKMYTAHTMWFEQAERMYSINYKKGTRIPVGTEVTDVVVAGRGRRQHISFHIPEWGVTCMVYYQAKFHSNKPINDIKDRMFSDQPAKEQLGKFSKNERESIEAGVVTKGMSKEAVLAAIGYPPEHRTPTIKIATWIYWLDRFRTREVTFDDDGKTIADMPL